MMYKPGIIQPEDIKKHQYNLLDDKKQYSYTLLQISEHPSNKEIIIFEKVIYNVKLSSGIFRTTYSKRFTKLDEIVLKIIKESFNDNESLLIYDWGASDGLTSLEWINNLSTYLKRVKLIASDLFFHVWRIDSSNGKTWILEPNGKALQYIHPPFVLSFPKPDRRYYFINRILLLWGRRKLKELESIVKELSWNGLFDPSVLSRRCWTIQLIPLVHPLVRKAFIEERLHLEIHDAFTPLNKRCHILRTMNLYNPKIFSHIQLERGIEAVYLSLEDHGIWIVGRTEEPYGETNASVFRKEHNGFILLTRVGNGSEIEDLIIKTNTILNNILILKNQLLL